MSTRANVIIKDEYSTLVFYRHSDGYPKCTGESLKDFVLGYKHGNMRLDAMQSAGWLVLKGHREYLEQNALMRSMADIGGADWKVGAYEPTQELHGDIEYIYVIDLTTRILSCRRTKGGFWKKPSLDLTNECAEFPDVSFAGKVLV